MDYGLTRTLAHQAEHGRKVDALLATVAHPTKHVDGYALHRDAPPVPVAEEPVKPVLVEPEPTMKLEGEAV